jgi:hypothetical protein
MIKQTTEYSLMSEDNLDERKSRRFDTMNRGVFFCRRIDPP